MFNSPSNFGDEIQFSHTNIHGLYTNIHGLTLNCAWAYPQSLEICDHFLREIWVCGVHWRAQASNQQIFSQQNRIFH